MKNTNIYIFFLLAFIATGFSACKKEAEVKPDEYIGKQYAGGKIEISVGMIMSGDEVLVGESAFFEPFIFIPDGSAESVDCGKIILQKQNAKTKKWEDIKDAEFNYLYGAVYTIPAVSFADSGYYRWKYISSGTCNFKSVNGGSLYLNVVKEYSEVYY